MNKDDVIEFFWLYGWAIFVVLAAIGALFYFGILPPNSERAEQFMTCQCTTPVCELSLGNNYNQISCCINSTFLNGVCSETYQVTQIYVNGTIIGGR